MATATVFQQTPNASVSMLDTRPAGLYPQGPPPQTGSGAVISNSQCVGMHVTQPSPLGTTVLVTQPVVTVPDSTITCAIVWSTLSSIFCCCICGITGILIAWKARLYLLKRKYEEASHSVSIVWLFFALAIFFGLVTWVVVAMYCVLILPGQVNPRFTVYDYKRP